MTTESDDWRTGWWAGAAAFRNHAEEWGLEDAMAEFNALLAAENEEDNS